MSHRPISPALLEIARRALLRREARQEAQQRDRDRWQRFISTRPPTPEEEARDAHTSPTWGNFWPAEHVTELDDDCYEPLGKRGEFLVCAAAGEVLATFYERWQACGCLNRVPVAAYVALDGIVIARKQEAAVLIGQRIEAGKAGAA